MKEFTNPVLSDGDTIETEHITELRGEFVKASLFCPHLDERPVRTATKEYEPYAANTEHTLLDVNGSGCVRTAHFVVSNALDTARVRFYFDGETTPRVDCTLREWGFAQQATTPAYYGDWQGFTGWGAYRHQPMPFHSRLKVTYTNTTATDEFWCDITYNYSATIDYNYGRYNYFNWSKAFATLTAGDYNEDAWHTFASITGKVGAVWGAYHSMSNTKGSAYGEPWEGNYEVYTDTALAVRGTGVEDYYLSSFMWDSFGYPNHDALLTAGSDLKSKSVGITAIDFDANTWKLGAYRLFDVSPLPFDSSFSMRWCNGDSLGANFDGENPARSYPGPTDSWGYVLYYTST